MSAGLRFVLLDIEGTTTPLDLVFGVLFPDARERVGDFLARRAEDPDVVRDVAALRDEHARDAAAGLKPPAWEDTPTGAAAYARWLMDQHRRLTALKSLQGRIWEEGYRSGRLRGQVYGDVPRALERWTRAGRRVAIFSSGSVLAQKLIFGHSDHGDLTPYLSGFFDTTTGAKGEAESYRRIAAELGEPPSAGVFLSDIVSELDAASEAGLATALVVRTPPGPTGHAHRVISDFDAV